MSQFDPEAPPAVPAPPAPDVVPEAAEEPVEQPKPLVTPAAEASGRRPQDVAQIVPSPPDPVKLGATVTEHDTILSDVLQRLRRLENRLGL